MLVDRRIQPSFDDRLLVEIMRCAGSINTNRCCFTLLVYKNQEFLGESELSIHESQKISDDVSRVIQCCEG